MNSLSAWVQSNLGASIVGGIVSGAVLIVGPKVLKDVPLNTIALVAGVAVIFGLLAFSVVNEGWRRRAWGWVGRARQRRRDRVVTSAQAQASLRNTEQKKGFALAVEKMAPRIESLETQVRDLKTERDALSVDLASTTEVLKQKGQGFGEPSSATPLPLPAPRWNVYQSGDKPGSYILKNAVPRSIAREVHIEGDIDFEVTDAGHWEDLSGEAFGDFRGSITLNGVSEGVRFTVTWWNESNTQLQAHPYLRGDGGPWARGNNPYGVL